MNLYCGLEVLLGNYHHTVYGHAYTLFNDTLRSTGDNDTGPALHRGRAISHCRGCEIMQLLEAVLVLKPVSSAVTCSWLLQTLHNATVLEQRAPPQLPIVYLGL